MAIPKPLQVIDVERIMGMTNIGFFILEKSSRPNRIQYLTSLKSRKEPNPTKVKDINCLTYLLLMIFKIGFKISLLVIFYLRFILKYLSIIQEPIMKKKISFSFFLFFLFFLKLHWLLFLLYILVPHQHFLEFLQFHIELFLWEKLPILIQHPLQHYLYLFQCRWVLTHL